MDEKKEKTPAWDGVMPYISLTTRAEEQEEKLVWDGSIKDIDYPDEMGKASVQLRRAKALVDGQAGRIPLRTALYLFTALYLLEQVAVPSATVLGLIFAGEWSLTLGIVWGMGLVVFRTWLVVQVLLWGISSQVFIDPKQRGWWSGAMTLSGANAILADYRSKLVEHVETAIEDYDKGAFASFAERDDAGLLAWRVERLFERNRIQSLVDSVAEALRRHGPLGQRSRHALFAREKLHDQVVEAKRLPKTTDVQLDLLTAAREETDEVDKAKLDKAPKTSTPAKSGT